MQLPQIWIPSDGQVAARQTFDDTLHGLVAQLQSIWTTLELDHRVTKTCMDTVDGEQIPMYEKNLSGFVPGPSAAPDSETAITVALYSLAWILILTEVRARSPGMIMSERLLLGHCDAVLRAGHFIEDFEDGCGLIRMVFPLRSVALHSPDPLQRECAKYRLELWRIKGGLRGICVIATATDTNILGSTRSATQVSEIRRLSYWGQQQGFLTNQ